MPDKEIDDKEMKEIDDSLQALADYIIKGVQHNIGIVMKPLSTSMLEALQTQIKSLKSENRKLVKNINLTMKNYNAFIERHNRESSAWSILKMALETRIHQLQMSKEVDGE